jgi:hypothetical protein
MYFHLRMSPRGSLTPSLGNLLIYLNIILFFECFCVREMKIFPKRKAEWCHPKLPTPIHPFPPLLRHRKG